MDDWDELTQLMARPETAERVIRLLRWKLPRLSVDDITDALYEVVFMLAELKNLDPGLPAAAACAAARPRLTNDDVARLQSVSHKWEAIARQNRWPRSPLLVSGNARIRNWLSPQAEPFIRLLRLTHWFAHDYRSPHARDQKWEDHEDHEAARPSLDDNLNHLALRQSVQAAEDPESNALLALLDTIFEETAQAAHPTKPVEWQTVYQTLGVTESEGRRLRRKLASLLIESAT